MAGFYSESIYLDTVSSYLLQCHPHPIIHNLDHCQVILEVFLVSGYGDRCVSIVYSQTEVYFSLELSPHKRGYLFQLGNSLNKNSSSVYMTSNSLPLFSEDRFLLCEEPLF